jgi:predicted HAD superfamily phosphohydrolase
MTLMRHMRLELLDLVDKIASDSITDVKLFEEIKRIGKKFCILLQG